MEKVMALIMEMEDLKIIIMDQVEGFIMIRTIKLKMIMEQVLLELLY